MISKTPAPAPLRRSLMAVALAALVLSLAACGGDSSPTTTTAGSADSGSAAAPDGEELFNRRVLGNSGGCVTCHSLTPGKVLVGPSLAGIADVAADRSSGVSATDYLRESIVSPEAYVVEGFSAGMMPGGWTDSLTDAEITALVDFMLTLSG